LRDGRDLNSQLPA